MNRLILIPLIMGALVGCVSQTEYMSKRGGRGANLGQTASTYLYHYGQIGGQGTGQSSMGTAVAFDGQKSFADFLQMVTTVKTLDAATKQLLYRQVTKRAEIGAITERQAIAANAAIAQSSTAAELQAALAHIAAGQ